MRRGLRLHPGDGDGYADIVVASYGSGNAYLYYGSAMGIVAASVTELGSPQFGQDDFESVAAAGDVNGDGFGDVIVGSSARNSVMIYPGQAGGISMSGTLFDSLPDGQYGSSVASAGDADGDGYDDVVIAPAQCTGFDVFVYRGSAMGVTMEAALRSWPAPFDAQCYDTIAR